MKKFLVLSLVTLLGFVLFLNKPSAQSPVTSVSTFPAGLWSGIDFNYGSACVNGNLDFNVTTNRLTVCWNNNRYPINAIVIPNASSTGTTLNLLAKLTGAPSTVVLPATTDNTNAAVIGVVMAGAGTSGSATIVTNGIVQCIFENSQTAGDFVTIGTSTAGDCHDDGSTLPTDGSQVIGRVLQTSSSTTVPQFVSLYGISSVTSGTATTLTNAILTNTTNQLALGASAHRVTISSIAPAGSSYTLTLPDAGGADSFALLALTQTFTNKTLTTPVVVQGSTAVASTLSPTCAANSGQQILVGATGGEVVTLPTPAVGCNFDFVISVSNTSAANEIETGASQYLIGEVQHCATGIACLDFWADGSATQAIKMDGAHLGGLKGSHFHVVGISTTVWEIFGTNLGTATMTTAFTATP